MAISWLTLASKLTSVGRIIFLQFCGFFERVKYYAIWTLTEVSVCSAQFFEQN